MYKSLLEKLLKLRNQFDNLLNEKEFFKNIGVFYGESGRYDLYLFPKHTEKKLNWDEAKQYCKEFDGDLPTIGEMQFIYDNNLDDTFVNNFYWCTHSNGPNKSNRMYKYLPNKDIKDTSYTYYTYLVRPVQRIYFLY